MFLNIIQFLIIFNYIYQTNGKTLLQARWNGKHPIPKRCLFLSYQLPQGMSTEILVQVVHRFSEVLIAPTRGKINCSMYYAPTDRVGDRLDSGNYTGVIGYLQRDEADLAIQFTRSDQQHEDEPIRLGGPVGPADIIICSKQLTTKNISIQVADVIYKVDPYTYHFTLFTVYIIL